MTFFEQFCAHNLSKWSIFDSSTTQSLDEGFDEIKLIDFVRDDLTPAQMELFNQYS